MIDNQIDETSGTVRLRARFANADDRLWPGQLVSVRVRIGQTTDALVVDAAAIQRGVEGSFVYRVVGDGSVEVLPVTVGEAENGQVAVQGELRVGDVIVRDGQSRLRPVWSSLKPAHRLPGRGRTMSIRVSLSSWFVRHPVATTLLTLAVILLGVAALPRLPVAPLPEAEFPTIRVNASLPGASAETMASAVATPLETQLTGVPGIIEMASTSALGSTSITLQFDLERTSIPPHRKYRRQSMRRPGACPATCRTCRPGARSTRPTARSWCSAWSRHRCR